MKHSPGRGASATMRAGISAHHNGASRPARVMLVDDHRSVREGLRLLLDAEPDITVVGQADTVAAAIGGVDACTPDIVVMDARLPDGSGVEACRTIRSNHPHVPLLMLTSAPDDEALFLSVMAGADGFVPKQIRGNRVVGAIRRILAGQSLHSPAETIAVLKRMRARTGRLPAVARLTPIERRITEMIAAGATNREIGDHAGIEPATVNDHVLALLSTRVGASRGEVASILADRWAPRGHG